jgi:hypothetical protein
VTVFLTAVPYTVRCRSLEPQPQPQKSSFDCKSSCLILGLLWGQTLYGISTEGWTRCQSARDGKLLCLWAWSKSDRRDRKFGRMISHHYYMHYARPDRILISVLLPLLHAVLLTLTGTSLGEKPEASSFVVAEREMIAMSACQFEDLSIWAI